jgi:SAM-dependent methyltransferase
VNVCGSMYLNDEREYGERIAAIYDDLYADYEEAMIDRLQELAGGGRALELGIGTGRVALPLAARGVQVMGIDASPQMVEKLRAKPGGEQIEVVMGSFAEFKIEGKFNLVYVVFNTIYNLLNQEKQLSCFRSVAAHLSQEGFFLIEAFFPDLKRFVDNQTVRAVKVETDSVQLEVTQHDPVNQRINSQHVFLTEEGTRLYPVELRYAWPSEFDLLAQICGLELKQRWGSWEKGPFTAQSGRHISVYGRPDLTSMD